MDKEDVRLVLHNGLEAKFPTLNVIFRPSGNHELTYPCVTYDSKKEEPTFANNAPYTIGTQFQVMFMRLVSDLSVNTRLIYELMPEVIVINSNSYTAGDVAHDVFIVSVHAT